MSICQPSASHLEVLEKTGEIYDHFLPGHSDFNQDDDQLDQVAEKERFPASRSPSVRLTFLIGMGLLMGDRMWSFTGALFLHELFPGTMLIPAIHGLVTGLSVILFGPLIGEWVDRTPRLRGPPKGGGTAFRSALP
jgi:Ferroportin1 (FPN1)